MRLTIPRAAVLVFWMTVAGAVCGEVHKAVEAGDLVKVKAILKKSPKALEETTEGGATPLHVAASTKNAKMVDLLLKAGANVNAKTKDGYTPLHWAAYVNATDVASLLLGKGADAGAKTQAGMSAFQVAVKENSSGVAKLLAQKTGASYKETFLDSSFIEGEKALDSGELARAYGIFNDLLKKDPGNEQINFALGMTCKSLRDYSRAQLAFERVIQINPANDRARFELARIYMDRKQFAAAKRELDLVLSHNPPPNVRAYAEGALERMREGAARWQYSGRLDAGVLYDSNVNVGPDSEIINISPIIFGANTITELAVGEDSKPKSAPGLYGSAAAMVGYDMGDPGNWLATGDVTYFRNMLDGASEFETGYYQGQVGLRNWGPRSVIQLPLAFSHIDYGHDPLVDIMAAGVAYTHIVGKASDWYLTTMGRGESRDYDTLNTRDGSYFVVAETIKHYVGPSRNAVLMGIQASHDYTDAAYYENTTIEWSLGGELRLPWSAMAYVRGRYTQSDYREKEELATEKRHDNQGQVTVGLNKMLRTGWWMDLNYQVTRNVSTFDLYEYDRDVVTLSTFYTF